MTHRIHTLLLAGFVALGILTTGAQAEQKFHPDKVISPQAGKWKAALNEKPLARIDCQVVRVSGGDDTYINFRFGDDGQTFPGGKRFSVNKSERMKITVPADGMRPNGKPLVINAYQGSVKLVHVTVHYK